MGAKASIRLEAIRELLRSLIAAGETEKAIDQPWAYVHDVLQKLAAGWPQRRICPSCMGRRMAEGAALLVDHVLPAVGGCFRSAGRGPSAWA